MKAFFLALVAMAGSGVLYERISGDLQKQASAREQIASAAKQAKIEQDASAQTILAASNDVQPEPTSPNLNSSARTSSYRYQTQRATYIAVPYVQTVVVQRPPVAPAPTLVYLGGGRPAVISGAGARLNVYRPSAVPSAPSAPRRHAVVAK